MFVGDLIFKMAVSVRDGRTSAYYWASVMLWGYPPPLPLLLPLVWVDIRRGYSM